MGTSNTTIHVKHSSTITEVIIIAHVYGARLDIHMTVVLYLNTSFCTCMQHYYHGNIIP